MTEAIQITIDGAEVQSQPGQTIMVAAEAAGIYIPHLCYYRGLSPHGSCRVCTVMANGRPQPACTTPVAPGMVIETESAALLALRRALIDMLFVEGNHFCMFCEKSGACELQALAYRFGIDAPQYPYQFPQRPVDATHPDILVDHNRCILCARCIRASQAVDAKHVFQFAGRGSHKRVGVNAPDGLGGTDADVIDKAISVCPVGAILRKRVGYAVPIGQRLFDHEPISLENEPHLAAPTSEVQ
jgi:[NiFe] hydrogenase diaphorase moiety small subunit